jgi:hypothetical protein
MKKIGSPPKRTIKLFTRPDLGDSRTNAIPTTTTVETKVGA